MAGLLDFLQGASKGFWAGNLGAPVDMAALAANGLIAAGGYAGHKLGLLQTPPDLIEKPVGGSEWIADKMRGAGLLQDNPGSAADAYGQVVGGLLGPLVAAKSPQIARGLLQAADNAMTPSTLNKQAGLILFHGTNDPQAVRQVNPNRGTFNGLFVGGKEQAQAHGKSLYRMTIPDDKVLTQRALDYDLPTERIQAALQKSAHYVDADDMEAVFKAVVDDASHKIDGDDLMRIFRADSLGEASWEAQRLRGQLAKELGYRAIAMSDEHGTSYLVPTPERLRPVNQSTKDLWRKK